MDNDWDSGRRVVKDMPSDFIGFDGWKGWRKGIELRSLGNGINGESGHRTLGSCVSSDCGVTMLVD